MCEYTKRIRDLSPAMSVRLIKDLSLTHVQSRFPYQLVREGHCPVCGFFIHIDERRPYGRATRSLCNQCYTDQIVASLNHHCFVCMGSLPHYKVQAQMANPREMKNNIHDEYCLDYFTLVHCKVVGGVDMSFLEDESYNINMQQISWENQNISTDMSTNIEQLSAKVLNRIDYIRNYSLSDAFNKEDISGRVLREANPNQRFIVTPIKLENKRFQTIRQKKDNANVRVIKLPEFENKGR